MIEATRIEIGTRAGFPDARGASVAARIRAHLDLPVTAVRTRDVYHVTPALAPDEARRVADDFAGPVLREGAVDRLPGEDFDVAVHVGFRPGVTDPVGKSAGVAIEDLLGRSLGPGARVYSSRLYLLAGLDRQQGERVAREILANELVERAEVKTRQEWLASPPDLAVPAVEDTPVPAVERIDLERSDDELVALSRERLLSLTLDELHAIRDHFRRAGDDHARREAGLDARPTDAELECLAQTWSEHCKHKIMNAVIRYAEPGQDQPETIHSLFRTCIRGTTERIDERIRRREGRSWLVSVFHDNAGVIAATDRHHLVFKVETHNSPSALDPFGGAITGIVGVNRDPFGTGLGADLLANVWGYCFADPCFAGELPAGLLHPRRIREGVHQGVIDGGNQSGIPYARGWEFYDERFLGKPLVYCGTVGRMPVQAAGVPAHEKRCRPGDRIVMVGGRIGKDGIHGATFSSAELTEESPVAAVQIGDPITQKMMFDFLLEARDLGLYSSITDNGAGGLSSSVGEMAEQPGGARMDLALAPLKYQGLAPWEILVSEAQERMTVAVPPQHLARFLELAARREVEATDLGEFTNSGVFHVLHGDETVVYLPLAFLHDGLPPMELEARWAGPRAVTVGGERPAAGDEGVRTGAPVAPPPDGAPAMMVPLTSPEGAAISLEARGAVDAPRPADGAALLGRFLARGNLAFDETLYRTYDHEVKALSVVRPFVGAHRDVPADASVLQIVHDRWAGYALAEGVFPTYSDVDAHAMAQAGVDLAVRRVIATGARVDRIAALDNYCWPDPLPGPGNPDAAHKLAQLVRASRGLAEICEAYGVPLISGKDSMKNDAVIGGRRISIPPTLLASVIALVDDVRRAITLAPPGPGARVLLVGETRRELAATEWGAVRRRGGDDVPRCRPGEWWPRYEAVAGLIRAGLVGGAHAPGRGGLLPALFRMARAAGCGLEADLALVPTDGDLGWDERAFSESCGRLLLACTADRVPEVLEGLAGHPVAVIGGVAAHGFLQVRLGDRLLVDGSVEELAAAWHSPHQPGEHEAIR
jgi:phosphoribosylformylglycinamidine synthase